MRHSIKAAVIGAAMVSAFSSAASAAVLTINLNDVNTFGESGDFNNIVNNYNIGAFSDVVGISYDLTITAFSPSWLSEVAIRFGDSDDFTIVFTPGFGDSDPGTASYSGSADLTALGLDFAVGADGILRLEYAEEFDDGSVNPDAVINGTLEFTYNTIGGTVPEPATWAMMIGGFGLVGGVARRSRRVATVLA